VIIAMEMAREKGCSWLLSIDADELVCPALKGFHPGQIKEVLQSIPEKVEAVRFLSIEIAQNCFSYSKSVFRQETLFQAPDSKVKRSIYDPFLKQNHTHYGFLGHQVGKCAVKIDSGSIPTNSHYFAHINGKPLIELQSGRLLHYNVYSFDDFIKKFRNFHDHPNTFLTNRAVPYIPKLLWRNLVNDPSWSMDDLASYYLQSVILHRNTIRNCLMDQINGFPVKKPMLIRFSEVVNIFQQISQP
jgi:hypothetical protein